MKKILFIFGELNDDDIDWIIATGSREQISAGTVLIPQGKPIDALYILLEGTLGVSVAALDDKKIATLSSGEVVGEMSFVDSRLPSATVEALEDSVVLAIPRSQLAEKLRLDVGFACRFYRAIAVFLSYRLRGTVNMLGYGQITQASEEDMKDIVASSPDAMDNVMLADVRFDWLLKRFNVR
jgi:bacteriocin-type transport-associated protein